MSVSTTADENIREAKQKLSEAYKLLLNVLDEDTWGHHEFQDGYIETVQEVSGEILKLKKKL